MELLGAFFPFIIMLAIMYFLLIRPQQKQQKKTQEMLDSITTGDSVITIGGLHGVVDEVSADKKNVVLDCEGIYLTFERRAIARVVSKGGGGTETVSTQAETEDLGTNDPEPEENVEE